MPLRTPREWKLAVHVIRIMTALLAFVPRSLSARSLGEDGCPACSRLLR